MVVAMARGSQGGFYALTFALAACAVHANGTAAATQPETLAPLVAPATATPTALDTRATQSLGLPSTAPLLPEVAEIRGEDFVYVAATGADRIGRVMAPVFVNGVGPFAFVVDTGASSSVIAPRLVTRLKLTPDPTRTMLLRGITGSEIVPSVAIDNITAGGISIPAKLLPVVESRVFADADGIFGADAFGRGCLHVSFVAKRVFIQDNSCSRSDPAWEIIPAKFRFGGLAVVSARVGRARVTAIVDTGAERSLGNPALLAALKLTNKADDPATRTRVHAATSQAVWGHVIPMPNIRLGGLQVDNLNVVFGDFEVFHMWGVGDEPAIVLGMDILGTTRGIMIDYKRQQLRLLPQGGDSFVIGRGRASKFPRS
jgi:hypothetical protein